MKTTRHIIVAGMTLTLAFGMTPATALAADDVDSEIVGEASGNGASTETGDTTSDDSVSMSLDEGSVTLETVDEPDDYDKEDFYSEDPAAALTRSIVTPFASTFTPVNVSEEMKYFSKWESHSNYDQGLSAGDGYHAMGYYQFDNRYGLDSFLIACYNYDPTTYSMFKWIADGADITGTLYNSKTGTLTATGQKLEDSWHAAYKANPSGFSALQDSWAYEKYYKPAEKYLKSIGIDISERADCVKGLVWGMSNLFGTSGWKKFVGGISDGYDWNGVYHYLSEGYKWPGAWNGDYEKANSMSDREFVTTLCNYVVKNVAVFYKGQPQYHEGWQNRYRDELNICLSYIAEDEAQQADSLTYNANGGTGKMSATEGTVNEGVEVADNSFVRDGYEFTGWNTKMDGSGKSYAAGSTYTLTDGDDVLYAQWKKAEEAPVVPDNPDSSDGTESGDSGSSSDGDSSGGSETDSGSGSESDGESDGAADSDGDAGEGGASNGNDSGDVSGGNGESDGEPSGGNDSSGVVDGDSDANSNDETGSNNDPGSNNGQNSGTVSGGASAESGSTSTESNPKDDSADDESDDGKSGASSDDAKKRDSESSDEGKETLLKTNDESAGIVAVLVGGFALAFGVAAGTLRRLLGRG